MPFIDSLAQYAKPIDTSGVSENLQQGLRTGMEMAARKDQNEKLNLELQFKKQQLEQGKDEHMTKLVNDIVKQEDPTLRKQLTGYAAKVGTQLGRPLSPEFTDAIYKSDDLRAAWLRRAATADTSDTETRYALMAENSGTMMGGPDKIAKFMNDVEAQAAKSRENAALAGNRSQLQDQKDQQLIFRKQITALADPKWQAMLMGDSGPEMQRRAQLRANYILARREQDKSDSMIAQRDAGSQARLAGIDQKDRALDQGDVKLDQGQQGLGIRGQVANQGDRRLDQGDTKLAQGDRGLDIRQQSTDQQGKNIDSMIDYRKSMGQIAKERVGLTAQSMELAGKRLSLSQQRLLNTIEGKVESDPTIKTALQSVQFADIGLSRLRPGMKWIDMYDVAADYNRLVTGNSRAAFAGEDRRTFDSYKGTLDKFMGKAANKEQGGPSDEEISLWRERMGGMRDLYAKQHDNKYLKFWRSKTATGLVPESTARTHFELNKLTENADWGAKNGLVAADRGQVRTGTPGPIADRPAIMGTQPPAPGTAGTAGSAQQSNADNAQFQAAERQRAMNAINAVKSGTLKGVDEATIRAKYRLKMSQRGLNGDL